jgi:hypothetical protein
MSELADISLNDCLKNYAATHGTEAVIEQTLDFILTAIKDMQDRVKADALKEFEGRDDLEIVDASVSEIVYESDLGQARLIPVSKFEKVLH